MNDILLICLVVSGALVCLLMCLGVIALVYYFLAQSIPAVTRQYAALLVVQKEAFEQEKRAIYAQRDKDMEAANTRTQTLLQGKLQDIDDIVTKCRYEIIKTEGNVSRLLELVEGLQCRSSGGGS